MTPTATPLSTIIALARAGALEHAWAQFSASGHDRRDDDPAALTVQGRLLKDRALRARGEEKRRLFVEAAAAYLRSAELQTGTYPLINAATLALLAGDRAGAARLAGEIVERIQREPDEPETPYWRGATLAEALLLLGRGEDSKAALRDALAAAPRAWEDHASTLRQFILIHEALDADAAWLDMLRPPQSLSWSGAGGPVARVSENELRERIAAALARERIGFVFGSACTGAGLLAAEAAIESGAELHLILPAGVEACAAACVGVDADWRARFDRVVEAAESVHMVRPIGSAASPPMLALASQISAGAARLNAERLMSSAAHLRFTESEPALFELCAALPPRIAPAGGGSAAPPIALLSISVGEDCNGHFAERLATLRELLSTFRDFAVAPHLVGDCVIAGFVDTDDAARVARAVCRRLSGETLLRIAGHFGFIPLLRDPFLNADRPSESGTRVLRAIAQAAPPATVCVSLDFAAALAAGTDGPSCAHWIGELHAFDGGTPIALYALGTAASDD
ncbi:MAG TPA: tetratricopeptide repeat-containing protein [Allosphingosinicella sp.]